MDHAGAQQSRRGYQGGFTLVEILVVLAILVLIIAVTMQGMLHYGQRQQYVQFASELKNGLQEARSKTMGSLQDSVYGVYVGTSSIQYFSGATPVIGSAANTIIPIPSYIRATPLLTGGVRYVTFARLTGKPSVTGTVTVFDTRTIATTTITIFSTGLVE